MLLHHDFALLVSYAFSTLPTSLSSLIVWDLCVIDTLPSLLLLHSGLLSDLDVFASVEIGYLCYIVF